MATRFKDYLIKYRTEEYEAKAKAEEDAEDSVDAKNDTAADSNPSE